MKLEFLFTFSKIWILPGPLRRAGARILPAVRKRRFSERELKGFCDH
ncbi:hypothetical protein B4135_0918 [Caldibacillus debilis]|uniref:Uncharacterized protein n=1 Tax=Caldibacillus debilis TaxID=301148 RepID=A0A150M7B4_9BACI|nr:hypothetical protein B4135_0918 [Caldibacillus debilis]